MKTACIRLAIALHTACIELEAARRESNGAAPKGRLPPAPDASWTERVGKHVALAVAAVPDSVLRAWLLDSQTVGGEEIYKTLKAGAGVRAQGTAKEIAA